MQASYLRKKEYSLHIEQVGFVAGSGNTTQGSLPLLKRPLCCKDSLEASHGPPLLSLSLRGNSWLSRKSTWRFGERDMGLPDVQEEEPL